MSGGTPSSSDGSCSGEGAREGGGMRVGTAAVLSRLGCIR
jgi:hypothetical protein